MSNSDAALLSDAQANAKYLLTHGSSRDKHTRAGGTNELIEGNEVYNTVMSNVNDAFGGSGWAEAMCSWPTSRAGAVSRTSRSSTTS